MLKTKYVIFSLLQICCNLVAGEVNMYMFKRGPFMGKFEAYIVLKPNTHHLLLLFYILLTFLID